ncbi:hypothetical protein Csa_019937 [Cucumis sativus]|uniref:Uncharacterized protein n=1 Tax=Cucumis sativus TaxID=3659 RepID=A0A0A0LZC9_CUCSA|nr:hypothetical protein Csa_019937 [Cucumis sativus]
MLFIWISSHLKYPSEFGCPRIEFSSPWNTTRNTVKDFNVVRWNPKTLDLSSWMRFFGHVTMEEIVWRAPWVPTSPLNISLRTIAIYSTFRLMGKDCLFSFIGIATYMV